VYLFNLVEKKFDGRLTLLVLDEAWLFLKNPVFAEKIAEWLKVLRKKNVFVVFATQDVADVERSPLKTTIIQQCLTKIYLADPSALTAGMFPVYRAFGLSDAEIGLIASATMKRDYFYTSPAGRRLFQLDLGPLTLALIGGADHALLDRLAAVRPPGTPLCRALLEQKGVHYQPFMDDDATEEPVATPGETGGAVQTAGERPPVEKRKPEAGEPVAESKIAELLDAIGSMPKRKQKDGSGRAAAVIARRFSVSQTTMYQAKKVLASGSAGLVEAMRRGRFPLKPPITACGRNSK
jgi:hypothetical protein